jgi:hypothetical protein
MVQRRKFFKGNPPLFRGGAFKGLVQHIVEDLSRRFKFKRLTRSSVQLVCNLV